MDFTVFNHEEIESIYNSMVSNMNEDQRAVFVRKHGSMDAFREYFMENALSPAAQENYRKVAEWYGGREKALKALLNPRNPGLLLDLAGLWKTNRQIQEVTDSIYGKGATEFWGRALEAFYAG